MPMRIVTRKELAEKLASWQSGQTSSEELLHWADELYASDDVDYDDWEEDDSATMEVLAALNLLDMNLVLPDDAPIYLAFLATPKNQFQSGYAQYKKALEQINHDARLEKLRDVPLYAPFVREQEG